MIEYQLYMKEKPFSLISFLPKEELNVEIEIEEYLAPVIKRISEIIPPDLLWEMFSSRPKETGGKIVFPHSRVDSSLIAARNAISSVKMYGHKHTPEWRREQYDSACFQAFGALLWVEIGFEGLENLAKSPASVNWTSGVGHFVNDQEREKGILTTGRVMFDENTSNFVRFRKEQEIKNDYFSLYKVEYLLDKYTTNT